MRKSKQVPLSLLAAAALASIGGAGISGLTGCHEEPAHCVDANNRLLPEGYYQSGNWAYGYGGAHYVYGGSSGGRVGDTVMGASISRGGFGHSGGGEGGGGE